jgi:hypothetical protein
VVILTTSSLSERGVVAARTVKVKARAATEVAAVCSGHKIQD